MSSFKRKARRRDILSNKIRTRKWNKHVYHAPCCMCGHRGSGHNERVHLGEGVFKIVCQECEWKLKKEAKKKEKKNEKSTE